MKSLYSYSTWLLSLIVLSFLYSNIYAQGTTDALRLGEPGLGSDARALGMGNSYIGLSDDAGAAFFNPAGWALIKSLDITGGLSYDNNTNNTTFLNQYSNYSNSATRLNNLSFVLPFPTTRGSLVFAISYNTTKDLTGALKFNGYNSGDSSYIQDLNSYSDIPYNLFLADSNYVTNIKGKLNQSGTILSSGSLHNWTFSGAIEAYKNLFIGLNLNIISGSYTNNNDYYEDDFNGIYTSTPTDPSTPQTVGFQEFHIGQIINWDISGWDVKFGMLYQIQNKARVGLTIQFPKTYTVKENYSVDAESSFKNFQSSPYNYSDKVQYDIVTPFEIAGGASYNIAGLILSGQATIIDYSQLQFQNPDGLSTQDIQTANKDIKNQLRSVLNYNLGAEYTIPEIGIRLRAGYFVMPSPYQSDASTSSYDKKYITGGIGYIADGAVGIDLAYAHGTWDNYGDNYGVNISRTFQSLKSDTFILSMTYRF